MRRPPAPAVNAPPSTGPMASEPPMASHSPKHSSFERRREHIAAALAAQKAGTQTGTARTGDGGSGGAVAAVMADLAVLQKARRDAGVGEGEGEGGNEEEWRPPEGQTGDGKTRLNEALGY